MKYPEKQYKFPVKQPKNSRRENNGEMISDPLGSYTGVPEETLKNHILTMPTQDADDL